MERNSAMLTKFLKEIGTLSGVTLRKSCVTTNNSPYRNLKLILTKIFVIIYAHAKLELIKIKIFCEKFDKCI